jgi:hypothetical protein
MRGKFATIVRWSGIGLIALLVVGYGLFQTRDLLFGAPMTLVQPGSFETVSDSHLRVVGKALHVSELTVNGGRVLPDSKGNFVHELILAYGHNTIELRARDRFGREIVKLVRVNYKYQ